MKFFYYDEPRAVMHVLDSELKPTDPVGGVFLGSVEPTTANAKFIAAALLIRNGYQEVTGLTLVHESKFNSE